MNENELKKFWGRRVKITSTDGIIVEGLAAYFTYAEDSETNEASLTIEKNFDKKWFIELMASEIKTIEIINDD